MYNFQRVFNLKLGFVTRDHDYPPYRAVGPVTIEEYESRPDFYDGQLKQDLGLEPGGLSTQAKIKRLRAYREGRYEQLLDAVYARHGWDHHGIPTPETLQRLRIDLPDVLEVVQRAKQAIG